VSSRWVRVCAEDDVPFLEGRRVVIEGYHVAVFRTEDGFYALHDVCPHRGGPLSDGDVAGGVVSCPLHARKVDLETGEMKNDGLSRVPAFPVKVEDGRVYVDPAPLAERSAV
jgi:nitrite reductase (NADH) small subunit